MARARARAGDPRPASAPPRRSHARPPGPAGLPQLVLVATVAAACVLVGVTFRLYDTDAWEHLAVGRAIWTLRQVPRTEIWTWPDFGQPNVNPSWGFSALVWPFWAAGGVMGLYLWRWITTLLVAALLWATARRLGARGLAALPVLVVCLLVYRQRVQIRPETLAGLWFALSAWILTQRRHGGPDRAGWLVPVTWAWVNSHVSYELAFVLLGIHLVAAAREGRADPSPRRLVLATAASAAVAFANPFGWHALARPFEFLFAWRHEALFRSIQELGPPVWSQNLANGLPLLLVAWPLFALWRTARGRGDTVEWLTLLVFTPLALSSSRFVATYVLAAGPFLARAVAEWLDAHPWPLASLPPWPRAAIAATLCLAMCLYDWTHEVGPLGFGFDMSRAPVAACDYIEANGVRGRGINHFQSGGYQLWRFWPARDRLPFMDIHPEDAPAGTRELYYRALTEPAGWRAIDDRFHFDYGLFSRRYADRPGLLDLLDADPGWTLVFVDDAAALYVRKDGPMRALAARDGYQTLGGSRAGIADRLRQAAIDPGYRAIMRRELERQAASSPVNFYGRAMGRELERLDGR